MVCNYDKIFTNTKFPEHTSCTNIIPDVLPCNCAEVY